MKVRDVGEFGLIDLIKDNSVFSSGQVIAGIGDDTAVLDVSGEGFLLATTDMMIENVHFIIDSNNGEKVGYRAMAANVSDIASMGGIPTHAVISIGVHPDMDVSYIEELYYGLKKCGKQYGANIVGGDTVSSPDNLVVNVALLGEVEKDKYLLRSGARPGDLIIVTGSLGDSTAGLDLILDPDCDVPANTRDYLLERHYYPSPRVKEINSAVQAGNITAADDISDGLGNELHEIVSASKVGAEIWFDSLPVSNELKQVAEKKDKDVVDYALFGGEDFEVVFTAPPEEAEFVTSEVEKRTGTKATIVGEILEASQGVFILRGSERFKLESKGYSHFS